MSAVLPSSSARIGVRIQLSLAFQVQRRKMTGTPRGLHQLAVQFSRSLELANHDRIMIKLGPFLFEKLSLSRLWTYVSNEL